MPKRYVAVNTFVILITNNFYFLIILLHPGGRNSCFEAFDNVKQQQSSIMDLRMKYFDLSVTKQSRRSILKQELLGMLQKGSEGGDRVIQFKINQKRVCE
jgi:hypothetical protein